MRIIKKRYMVTVLSFLIVSTISFNVFGFSLARIRYTKGPHLNLSQNELVELYDEYRTWRHTYLTVNGCPNSNQFRVQRDASTNYDTVSEGQAYGMLLAVIFNDKFAFDRLHKYYDYFSRHTKRSSTKNGIITNNGLMHWKINRHGEKVSEFLIPFEDPAYGTGRKHDIAYASLSFLQSERKYKTEGDIGYETGREGTAGWVQVHKYERGHSSATDADLDAMAAYMMASYRWWSDNQSRNKYTAKAAYVLTKIFDFQIGGDGGFQDNNGNNVGYDLNGYFIRAGCQWGGPSAFNPSYFTPAWFHLAKRFLNDFRTNTLRSVLQEGLRYQQKGGGADPIDFYIGECDRVLITMYDTMDMLDDHNWNGLYPDWVDVSSGTPRPAAQSDRMYWVDRELTITPDGRQIIGSLSRTNGSYCRQSYNCYYDAIRVPWRILQAWNLYADTRAEKLGAEIRGKERNFLWRYKWTMNTSGSFHRNKSFDGYNWQKSGWTGIAWLWNQSDAFNINIGGRRGSITFSSMFAITTMFMNNSSHRNIARNAFDYLLAHKETDSHSHYYGNTLRMLSLAYLAGGFGDYSQFSNSW